ncbi:hypothetical protein DENSPDRAFT_228174 [Dentipellis sp. KUC8613]|nr:hypothetical protein DENSPDRAFT_228174 [Dentipellis sp. KUC8613]
MGHLDVVLHLLLSLSLALSLTFTLIIVIVILSRHLFRRIYIPFPLPSPLPLASSCISRPPYRSRSSPSFTFPHPSIHSSIHRRYLSPVSSSRCPPLPSPPLPFSPYTYLFTLPPSVLRAPYSLHSAQCPVSSTHTHRTNPVTSYQLSVTSHQSSVRHPSSTIRDTATPRPSGRNDHDQLRARSCIDICGLRMFCFLGPVSQYRVSGPWRFKRCLRVIFFSLVVCCFFFFGGRCAYMRYSAGLTT